MISHAIDVSNVSLEKKNLDLFLVNLPSDFKLTNMCTSGKENRSRIKGCLTCHIFWQLSSVAAFTCLISTCCVFVSRCNVTVLAKEILPVRNSVIWLKEYLIFLTHEISVCLSRYSLISLLSHYRWCISFRDTLIFIILKKRILPYCDCHIGRGTPLIP